MSQAIMSNAYLEDGDVTDNNVAVNEHGLEIPSKLRGADSGYSASLQDLQEALGRSEVFRQAYLTGTLKGS